MDRVVADLADVEAKAAAPVAKPRTESFSRRMVVELSSEPLRPLGLAL